ncbi:MAG: hypothetical protein ABIH23_05745 [bacterium]
MTLNSKRIEAIIGSHQLAVDIHKSISSALRCPFVRVSGGKTVWAVFKHSLNTAIRGIEKHPRGKLFRRLIEFGPHDPDDPETLDSDGETVLSDPECESCVEVIYSHMVNRFKGELAELLALDSCLKLVQQLREKGRISSNTVLYWGDAVQERRRPKSPFEHGVVRPGSFTKGADGLIVEPTATGHGKPNNGLKISGVIEVKSMRLGKKRILNQINGHITRLQGGVKLGNKEWSPDDLVFRHNENHQAEGSSLARVLVMPSNWKLSREWTSVKTGRGREIVFPAPSPPSSENRIEELESDIWKITLTWSQEALAQATYKMTFWYMSQVGRHVYRKRALPKGWEYMTPEQAGYNAMKMMLYYVPLRYISERHERLAIRLYNVYCFGYPAGTDSKEMLWPQDFPDTP